jgi:hypothetical protein
MSPRSVDRCRRCTEARRGAALDAFAEKGMAMSRSTHGPTFAFQTSRTPSGRAVAQRRRVIVALLQQAPHGLTSREIQEATGFSKDLTVSALTGLFVYGVVHKCKHCYVLTAPAEACEPSAQR